MPPGLAANKQAFGKVLHGALLQETHAVHVLGCGPGLMFLIRDADATCLHAMHAPLYRFIQKRAQLNAEPTSIADWQEHMPVAMLPTTQQALPIRVAALATAHACRNAPNSSSLRSSGGLSQYSGTSSRYSLRFRARVEACRLLQAAQDDSQN
jgi:hypothetical protein